MFYSNFASFGTPQNMPTKTTAASNVHARAYTKETASHFFNEVLLLTHDQLQLHHNPSQVYNADEIFLALSSGTSTVLARKETKQPQHIGGSGRENITIHVYLWSICTTLYYM